MIILGCTHYPILKNKIRKLAKVPVISQDEYIPRKIKNYLKRHPEIDARLSRNHSSELLVADITRSFNGLSQEWFGKRAKLIKVKID